MRGLTVCEHALSYCMRSLTMHALSYCMRASALILIVSRIYQYSKLSEFFFLVRCEGDARWLVYQCAVC